MPPTWSELFSRFPEVPPETLRWWLSDLLRLPLTGLPLASPAAPDDLAAFEAAAPRLAAGEPVQYVCGRAPFLDFELRVDPRVLIPRPETEELVEHILRFHGPAPLRALDIGTGSGCIAIALQRARPAWHIQATDLSLDALELAHDNGRRLAPSLRFHHADLLDGFPPASRDLLVANLPYIGTAETHRVDPNVLAHEPHLALFSGHDGTDLMLRLLGQARHVIAPGGSLWLESGDNQVTALSHAAPALGWTFHNLIDLRGKPRFWHLRPVTQEGEPWGKM